MERLKKYNIVVEAKVTAQNIDSANKKADELTKKIEKSADWVHITVKGESA